MVQLQGTTSGSASGPLLLAAVLHSICCYEADLEDTDLPGQRAHDAITGVPSGDAALSVCTGQAYTAMEAHCVHAVIAA